ncbi:leucyl aminopeptidase family protein [Mesorhizobium australicum]|uniref:Leucyl aminopeptidase n=1 Tax=Mesorhizobium australicum TaxID=536018 RepID=A0A1X7NBD1_9HYPH|nr:leucyl aminopeptidase family protein [Mesorhizobium australicum]SMH34930.1 leucyl aminopeptidase [Mesorhizobium australicum]
MPVTLVADRSSLSRPVHLVAKGALEKSDLPAAAIAWAKANAFTGEEGRTLLLADGDGNVSGALFGLGDQTGGHLPLLPGALARTLPEGDWHFATALADGENAVLGLLLGGYAFTAYGRKPHREIRFAAPEGVDRARAERLAEGVFLARDLINTPTNDMGPDDVEAAARRLAATHDAEVAVIAGDELLARNFPMIHAVGRASAQAPRLIDIRWGREDAPKVTLVGKGVCFDTGGLDIKPASGMLLMKKDMGGAANVMGLAHMIMAAKLPLRLRVLLPVVENSIAGNAFRPGDILRSRKGTTVEIGNTDAEGRLILGDALAYGDEEAPELMVDMATLTGAARVALGPDLPPFFTDDEALAADLARAAATAADPLWRLPLWMPYDGKYSSKVADINNTNTDGFAGSIIAALFLKRFVQQTKSWAHFDIFGWNPVDRPHGIAGGEGMAIRALEKVISERYRA